MGKKMFIGVLAICASGVFASAQSSAVGAADRTFMDKAAQDWLIFTPRNTNSPRPRYCSRKPSQ